MADGFSSRVILCWPSDRKAIDLLNSRIGEAHQFRPTVDHSLSTCDSCNAGIWIAEQQRQLAESPFLNAKKLCMFCVGQAQRILDLDAREVDLSPQARAARRRIA